MLALSLLPSPFVLAVDTLYFVKHRAGRARAHVLADVEHPERGVAVQA